MLNDRKNSFRNANIMTSGTDARASKNSAYCFFANDFIYIILRNERSGLEVKNNLAIIRFTTISEENCNLSSREILQKKISSQNYFSIIRCALARERELNADSYIFFSPKVYKPHYARVTFTRCQ